MVQTSGDYARTDTSQTLSGYILENDTPQAKAAADWEAQADADAAMRRDIRFLGRRVAFLELCAKDEHLRLTQFIATLDVQDKRIKKLMICVADLESRACEDAPLLPEGYVPGEGGEPESLAETIAHATDACRFTGR